MSKIRQTIKKPSSKEDPCDSSGEKQWQTQYYVYHVETGYMED